jgi:hypothetical protein
MPERMPDERTSYLMAHAEAPYRDFVLSVIAEGFPEESESLLREADKSSLDAGRFHLNEIGAILTGYEIDLSYETDLYREDVDELTKNQLVNKEDFYHYSSVKLADRPSRVQMVAAGAAWGSLGKLYAHKILRETGRSVSGEDPRLPSIPLVYNKPPTRGERPDGAELHLDSLVELIRNYDTYKTKYEGMKDSKILGKQVSTARISFVRHFLLYKIAELRAAAVN